VHKFKHLSDKNFEDILVRAALRGAENIFKIEGDHKPKRVVMSLQLLKLLGHEIAASNWEEDSKRVMWTACSVAFFGALRLGEMLCHSETSFDPTSTLIWDDVKFIDHDTVLLHLKLPKSNAEHGEFIDLFPFPGCCPVAALKGLKESDKKRGGEDPVFMFKSGKLLTVSKFTSVVRCLLQKHVGEKAQLISAHSFRGAIPSILAKFPDTIAAADICNWGRWSSTSFLTYTRLKHKQKLALFEKISEAIRKDTK
jgi:hypothetical protein